MTLRPRGPEKKFFRHHHQNLTVGGGDFLENFFFLLKKFFFFLLKKILEIFGKKLSKIRLFLINSESWRTPYLGAENEKKQNLKIPADTLFRGRK